MAVIIPDMDIPSNCMACKLSYSSPFGDVMCAVNGYRANKQKCPLKLADECKGEDCVSRAEVLKLMQDNWHTHNGDWAMQESIDAIRELPSVTPQLSSELEKNSKKLEKDFGELDCISRADAIRVASGYCHPSNVAKELAKLPSVTPQEPQTFKWCETCKEYDQEKHCCHRYSKVIRDTVDEMKQEQEPVVDKIRAEIEQSYCEVNNDYDQGRNYGLYMATQIIDKYKAESEET